MKPASTRRTAQVRRVEAAMKAANVECPTCGAHAGQPCTDARRTVSSRYSPPIKGYHPARMNRVT